MSRAIVPAAAGIAPAVQPAYDALLAQLGAFAVQHLPDEYLPILHEAAAALAHRRPSPLVHGKAVSWACGIVHAIGAVNFLFDTTRPGHMSAAEVAQAFGVGVSTGSAKAAEVRRYLQMSGHHLRWQVPSMLEKNPLVQLVLAGALPVAEDEPPQNRRG